jgi:hypothetical protein
MHFRGDPVDIRRREKDGQDLARPGLLGIKQAESARPG